MLKLVKKKYKEAILSVLKTIDSSIDESYFHIDTPPDREKGDLAVPLFKVAKASKKNPTEIADKIKVFLENSDNSKNLYFVSCVQVGGFLNIFLDKNKLICEQFKKTCKNDFKSDALKNEKIMIEFSCPNTNKPLHLGHMRNDSLGMSISNLLKEAGAEVYRVNLVNDRGIHICKSMLAYKLFGDNCTPESTGIKADRFVGDFYVKYNNYEKENEEEAKSQIAQMLLQWENEDKEIRELWQKMRTWALSGIQKTYDETGIVFDKTYYESEIYKKGKDEVLKGLEKNIFYRDKTGAIMVNIDDKPKVLLRSDGTSIYLTQDIGTAIKRHNDWPYTSCIYVVGNEQKDHFKTLFAVLEKLGFSWSKKLKHLSYGMVNLPNGRMKSREGTVVDADDLIESLSRQSLESMKDKIEDKDKRNEVSKKIALGALNYFLLSQSPEKDMIFNPEESLSFTGDTGPYIQYTGARISSLLKKSNKQEFNNVVFKTKREKIENDLIVQLCNFSYIIEKSALSYDPSILTGYLYGLCKIFSSFYHDLPILKAQGDIREERLAISYCVLCVLQKGFELLNIPFLDEM